MPPYLVMELVDGPSLARLLDDGPLDPVWTMGLIAQAAAALHAAHTAGLVHRDIKPGNLLVGPGGVVKIADFGICHVVGSLTLTRPGTVIGTPAYLAPERAAGRPATPAADLYALGIVAFQCLAGHLPFTGEPLAVALAHLERPLPPLPPWVPAEAAALVARLTAKDPRARPASAWEVARRAAYLRTTLTATAADQAGKQPRRPAAGKQHRRSAARFSYAALAATGVATLAATGWMMTGAHGPAPAHWQPGPPAAGSQSSPSASHPARRAAPRREASITSITSAPGQDRRRRPSRHSPASTGTATPGSTSAPASTSAPSASLTPSGTPAPTGSATPSGTPTPTGTATPSGTPAPSGTATPSGAPTSTGTPTPSATPTSASGSGPATAAVQPA